MYSDDLVIVLGISDKILSGDETVLEDIRYLYTSEDIQDLNSLLRRSFTDGVFGDLADEHLELYKLALNETTLKDKPIVKDLSYIYTTVSYQEKIARIKELLEKDPSVDYATVPSEDLEDYYRKLTQIAISFRDRDLIEKLVTRLRAI